MKWKVFLLTGAAALAAVAMACGDDDDPKDADASSGGDVSQPGGDAAGGGLTLPNTWLEFDGEKRQLTNILFDGTDARASEFTKVGSVTAIDSEGTTGDVFQRAGDADAVWTYTPAGDAANEEPNGMWHRWAAPPADGEGAAS